MSDDGNVAVGRLANRAAVWRPSISWTSLTPSDGFAYKSSRDGSAVAGFSGASSSTPFGNQAFRWTPTGGVQNIGGLPGVGTHSKALGISADGNVIVGDAQSLTASHEAFRWTQATGMLGLGASLGNPTESEAHGASFNGSVIVGDVVQSPSSQRRAFHWNNGVVTVLNGSPASGGGVALSSAWAVSDNGSTVVGISGNLGGKAARWTQATGGQLLGGITPTDGNSEARDLTADGSIITGFSDVAGVQTAFIRDADNGMRDLKQVLQGKGVTNLTGWKLHWAYISDDGGTVGGFGTTPSNQPSAWLVTNLPEPAAAAVMLVVLAPLALSRLRR